MKLIRSLIWLCCVLILTLADDVAEQQVPGDPVGSNDVSSDDDVAAGLQTDSAFTAVPHHADRQANSQSAIQLYRHLLKQKRAAHFEAMKKIVGLNSYDKQQKMLKSIFVKLFEILVDAKVRLAEYSFVPTDPFPTDMMIMEAFSTILENTAFLGDIVLRLPDIAHELLDKNADWKSVTQWAVQFTNDSGIFIDKDHLVISMMAQELELVEKDPNFVNPYKQENKVEQIVDEELQKILAEQRRKLMKKQKKEQKKRTKGPRMSRVEL